MIPSNYLLVFAMFLFLALTFYSVESFITSNATSLIHLTKDMPISKIELECVREVNGDTWINLADLTIIDEHDKKVQYWVAPNSVHMANGDLGYLHQWGPIHELYDGNVNTCAHSSTSPDKLTIILSPPLKLGSIQITNRNDCPGCDIRIMKYDMKLYNKEELLGSKPLTNLGEVGKTVTYLISKSSGKGMKGDTGPAGPIGPVGPIGPAGPLGPAGSAGPAGPAGPIGTAGPAGLSGPAGPAGPEGVQGPIGKIGPIGPAGPIGLQGPIGKEGPQGVGGPIGPRGLRGKSGDIGLFAPENDSETCE